MLLALVLVGELPTKEGAKPILGLALELSLPAD